MKIVNRATPSADEKSALLLHKWQRGQGMFMAKSVIFLVMFAIILSASYQALKPQEMARSNALIGNVSNAKIDSFDKDTRQENIRLLQSLRMKNVRRGQSMLSAAKLLKVNLSENVCASLSTLEQVNNDWQPNAKTPHINNGVSSAVEIERNTHILRYTDADVPSYGW
ncbi:MULTISPECIES: hypothetical protein [Alteromonadaceae]|uniref:Uncharacterized protein n=1 Tax=Brumicola blandensis TaxID=3075611 RepID=A0AAW8QYZ1_9ALTE|nr:MULTISPECIES: hypothetical protein [unclassified Alteromonas]MDT0581197.1 hypothetical protein [Alteromonas sp. W409]MDT0626814.1 hypothetical protein [Alteromonas sp. W364]